MSAERFTLDTNILVYAVDVKKVTGPAITCTPSRMVRQQNFLHLPRCAAATTPLRSCRSFATQARRISRRGVQQERMSRLPRIAVPGCPHHVTARGNRRAPIFFEDGDQDICCDMLAGQTRKAEVEVWA